MFASEDAYRAAEAAIEEAKQSETTALKAVGCVLARTAQAANNGGCGACKHAPYAANAGPPGIWQAGCGCGPAAPGFLR